ncbi:MAG: acyltransferase [Victivallales bacterium]|nr:acyltransferase [Victivallales bacterium]
MNTQLLIFKALAIIDVVLRHKFWPFSSFLFIASSIPLFLFLSGYFYKPEGEGNPLRFIVKKIRRLLILYFVYNAFYALITYLIFRRSGVVMGQLPNWYNFFIQPFVDGQQYTLINPMWFIPFFFMVQMAYMFSSRLIRRFTRDELVHFLIFAAVGLAGYGLRQVTVPGHALLQNFVLKLMVGAFFISLGRMFAQRLVPCNVYRVKFLILALALRGMMFIEFSSPCYNFAGAGFQELSGMFYSIIDIYILLYLSRLMARIPLLERMMSRIGSNTYHIMANHMMVFLVIDTAITGITGIDPNNPYGDMLYYTWPVYLAAGIGIPTCVGMVAKFLRKRVAVVWNEVRLPEGRKVMAGPVGADRV